MTRLTQESVSLRSQPADPPCALSAEQDPFDPAKRLVDPGCCGRLGDDAQDGLGVRSSCDEPRTVREPEPQTVEAARLATWKGRLDAREERFHRRLACAGEPELPAVVARQGCKPPGERRRSV